MRRRIFLWLFVFAAANVCAQEKFTDKLAEAKSGEGVVRVFQDVEISALVNGNKPAQSGKTGSAGSSVRMMKANGYRIQVYAGGNSRASKVEAQNIAAKVKNAFPDWTVYTHFQSPRWICRVGDFLTYEEAQSALSDLRETNEFNEALIVKTVIQVPY